MEPRRGWVTVDGRRLETAWWGPGPEGAPSLVLLHEGLGCISLWRDFPARLVEKTGRGVFAWSRAGYGQSAARPLPWPASYMHEEAARCVAPVLEAAGVRDCVLVGHSDGASIAAIYAGTHDDARVKGLVLLAPHFMVEPECLAGIAAARERFGQGDLRARLARHHADVDVAFYGWNDAWGSAAFRDWDITAEAARISVPVMVVQGLADPYGTVAQVHAAGYRAQGVMLEGVGHSPHLEAPGVVLDDITAFCNRLAKAA